MPAWPPRSTACACAATASFGRAHRSSRRASLLNSLGWVAATEGTDLYVNLPVDCMINVSTPRAALHRGSDLRNGPREISSRRFPGRREPAASSSCVCRRALRPTMFFSTAADSSPPAWSADTSWWIAPGATMRKSTTICPSAPPCWAIEVARPGGISSTSHTPTATKAAFCLPFSPQKRNFAIRIFKVTYGNYR